MILTTLLAALGGIVVFRGAPNGAGDVLAVDPSGVQAPVVVAGLDGVTLLPIELNGRTHLDDLRFDRPRARTDVPGASRIELPGGAGSLYRYSRPGAAGLDHGFFVVDAVGTARSLIARAGIGVAADQSPFVGRVAVSPTGDKLLVATLAAAGGDLLEVDVATATILDRTSGLAPQDFLETSLHVAPTWVVAASAQGLWRYQRATAADVELVPLPAPAPTIVSGAVVLSRNGRHALATAGSAANLLDVFAFDATGPARRVTTAQAAVSPAGFLPTYGHGPFLAISDDGTRCAWRATVGLAREVFLAEVPALAPTTNEWLTSDTNYIDTIDEIGQVMFKIGTGVLVYAAGELDPVTAAIENLDFFTAQVPATGGATIQNVTQTSGIAQPPFLLPANLEPDFVNVEPSSEMLVFHNGRSGGTGELVGVDLGQTGYTVLVPNVKDVEFIERAGNFLYVDLRRKLGNDPRELHRFTTPLTPSSTPLLTVSGLHGFERTAVRADGWFAFVETTAVKERLWRCNPALPAAQQLTDRALFFGPAIDWAPSGELAFTVGLGGTQSIFAVWPTSQPVRRLPLPVQPGFVLPGS